MKKNFSGPKFVFRRLWWQHPSLHITKGPARKPISGTPPPPSPGAHASPPPPPAKQFSGRPVVCHPRSFTGCTIRALMLLWCLRLARAQHMHRRTTFVLHISSPRCILTLGSPPSRPHYTANLPCKAPCISRHMRIQQHKMSLPPLPTTTLAIVIHCVQRMGQILRHGEKVLQTVW